MTRIGGLVLAAGAGWRFGGRQAARRCSAASPLLAHVLTAMEAVPALDPLVLVLGVRRRPPPHCPFVASSETSPWWTRPASALATVYPSAARAPYRRGSACETLDRTTSWVVCRGACSRRAPTPRAGGGRYIRRPPLCAGGSRGLKYSLGTSARSCHTLIDPSRGCISQPVLTHLVWSHAREVAGREEPAGGQPASRADPPPPFACVSTARTASVDAPAQASPPLPPQPSGNHARSVHDHPRRDSARRGVRRPRAPDGDR